MPIVPQSSNILQTDNVLVASSDFYANPELATATLRRVAARNLGISDLMEHGTVEEYRNLGADLQVALTDEMAYLIASYPNSFPLVIQQSSNDRVQSPLFRAPLADPSFGGNLMDQVASGEFTDNLALGGASFLKDIGTYVAGGLILYFVIQNLSNRRVAAASI